MMDPSSMIPYETRAAATVAPLQRPAVASHYMMNNAYTMAPVTTMAAPHYQPAHHFNFNSYTAPQLTPTPLAPPYRPYTEERPALRLVTEQERPQAAVYARDVRPNYVEDPSHSSIKMEPQVSPQRAQSIPNGDSRNITPNTGKNGETQVEFHTKIDMLMKAIQSKPDGQAKEEPTEDHFTPSPQQTKMEPASRSTSPEEPSPTSSKDARKRYLCDISSCMKRFAQKTHLLIHQRSHTGEKPYMCKQPGCGLFFSQLGNLKTHERRHTGERPYTCDQCGKAFAQRGNVRAHKAVHNPEKRFHCRLDDCQKDFSQLGNLKSHQNRFHSATLDKLYSKFATMKPEDVVNDDDKELFEYFATLYKNSNKGIKGRGKDRKVGPVAQSPNNAMPNHYPVQQPTPPMHHGIPHHMPHLPHPVQHGLAHPSSINNHYSMPRTAPAHPHMVVQRDHRGYEMYDMDQESLSGSGAATSTPGTIYDEDHSRELAFGDRMY